MSTFKCHLPSFINSKVPLMFGSKNSPDLVKETGNLPPDHISPQLKLHDSTALNKGQITRLSHQ